MIRFLQGENDTFIDCLIIKIRASKLLTSNQQQCSVHDSGTVQHRSHKNVVTGTIDEAHMTY